MNTLLLRTLELKKSPSVQTFAQYRESESQNCKHSSVTSEGQLLEHQTLELRVHPPNVTIDNESYDDRTVVTVDSANRPGTLVEVVQCLTELGLNVKRARISSDGGWFVDEFHVTEANDSSAAMHQGRKVISEAKLKVIKAVLNVDYDPEPEPEGSQHGGLPTSADGLQPHHMQQQQHHHQHHATHLHHQHGESTAADTFDEVWQHSTVFEMAGADRAGLLADVLALLTHNGCDVRSAAVWTYSGRVAFVVSVVEASGAPIRDAGKLLRLRQLLHGMMDAGGHGIVTAQPVKGLIHYERRLHQLMLKEEEKEWLRNRDAILARAGITPADAGCSCACHDVMAAPLLPGGGGGGTLPATAAAAAAAARSGNGLVHSPSPAMQQQGGGCSSCCCQEERRQLHIVRSEPAPHLTAAPGGPAGHSPRSSLGSAGGPHPQPLGATTYGDDAVTPPAHPTYVPGGGEGGSGGGRQGVLSPKFSRPDVTIQHYAHLNYWLVTIRCKDRNKLFFDTVCTLSDLDYDVYHGAIDSEGEVATQLYYIRPRFGDLVWDGARATKLRVMLEAAIQRRFPKGLKVHVRHLPTANGTPLGQNWLADLTAAWREAGLWITRAKVRAYTDHGHTLYVMDCSGQPPDPRKVQAACQAGGGQLHGPAEGLPLGASPRSILAGLPMQAVGGAGAGAAAKAAGGADAAGGNGVLPGTGAKFFYALQQRVWDGSPSSFTSL